MININNDTWYIVFPIIYNVPKLFNKIVSLLKYLIIININIVALIKIMPTIVINNLIK